MICLFSHLIIALTFTAWLLLRCMSILQKLNTRLGDCLIVRTNSIKISKKKYIDCPRGVHIIKKEVIINWWRGWEIWVTNIYKPDSFDHLDFRLRPFQFFKTNFSINTKPAMTSTIHTCIYPLEMMSWVSFRFERLLRTIIFDLSISLHRCNYFHLHFNIFVIFVQEKSFGKNVVKGKKKRKGRNII